MVWRDISEDLVVPEIQIVAGVGEVIYLSFITHRSILPLSS